MICLLLLIVQEHWIATSPTIFMIAEPSPPLAAAKSSDNDLPAAANCAGALDILPNNSMLFPLTDILKESINCCGIGSLIYVRNVGVKVDPGFGLSYFLNDILV